MPYVLHTVPTLKKAIHKQLYSDPILTFIIIHYTFLNHHHCHHHYTYKYIKIILSESQSYFHNK